MGIILRLGPNYRVAKVWQKAGQLRNNISHFSFYKE